LEIDGNTLQRVESTKFLGVQIESKLNWEAHINYLAPKISRALGIINRLKFSMPRSVLLTLYNTLICPYFNYCNIIWSCAKPTVIQRVATLQKRAVRLITNSYFRAKTGPLFHRLNSLKLEDIYKVQVSLFVFKFKCNLLPASCMHYFTYSAPRLYNTRNVCSLLKLNNFRTDIRERSICIDGPRVWNSLPTEIQSCTSIGMLKRAVLQHFVFSYAQ
jgi:hypothetical protein